MRVIQLAVVDGENVPSRKGNADSTPLDTRRDFGTAAPALAHDNFMGGEEAATFELGRLR